MDDFVATTLALLIFSFMVLAPGFGNGAEVFFDMEVTAEELQVIPELPQANPEPIDISDTYARENVTVVDTDTLSNPEFNTSQAVRLENGSSSGFVVYRTPDIAFAEITSSTYGFFENSPMEGISLDQNRTEIDVTVLNGETAGNVDPDTEYLKVEWSNADTEDILYEIETSETQETGLLDSITKTAYNLATFPLRLWEFFTKFPIYVQLFYGGMLSYLVVKIIRGF